MNKLNRSLTSLPVLLVALLAGTAGAHGLGTNSGGTVTYGNAAAEGQAARTIVVTPSTKYINVTSGETVEFSVEGKSFNWHFDAFENRDSFGLDKIAPAGTHASQVRVYVEANPLYRG